MRHYCEARGTNEVRFGGPCRGRTYGPLIKSLAADPTSNTQQEELLSKREDS